jgi:hypothetical protein
VRSFESRTLYTRLPWGSTAAPTLMGPAQAPRPTSSTPTMTSAPAAHASRSWSSPGEDRFSARRSTGAVAVATTAADATAVATPVRAQGPRATVPTVPSSETSWCSVGSIASALSILSLGSAGSVLSIGSAGSILSIGSAGSIASIGSAGSIASIGSVGSVAAVGAAGRVGGVGAAGGLAPALPLLLLGALVRHRPT